MCRSALRATLPSKRGQAADLCSTFCSEMVSLANFPLPSLCIDGAGGARYPFRHRDVVRSGVAARNPKSADPRRQVSASRRCHPASATGAGETATPVGYRGQRAVSEAGAQSGQRHGPSGTRPANIASSSGPSIWELSKMRARSARVIASATSGHSRA